MTQKKYSNSVDFIRQSSQTRPNTKLILKLLQGKKPLLGLEFNKANKQNVYENNWLKNSSFLSLKIIGDTDWCQE